MLFRSILLVYKGVIDFTWDGVVGLSMGSILLLTPKTIEKKVSEVISAWGGKKSTSSNENQGD